MTYTPIPLPDVPGIMAMLQAYPKTGEALRLVGQAVLGEGTPNFSRAEREAIAAKVSKDNETPFCFNSHRAVTIELCGGSDAEAKDLMYPTAMGNLKMYYLHVIADLVRRCKTPEPVCFQQARIAGATDETIHDTVLIASVFSMYNRYVTALNPRESTPEGYKATGQRIASRGYILPTNPEPVIA